MAENIGKIYPGGIWYEDNDEQRHRHILDVLKLYSTRKDLFDDQDVRWFIKQAIINNIYISEGVYNLGDRAWKFDEKGVMRVILKKLQEDGYLDGKYMYIRKFCNGKNVRFEHVLPSKEYLRLIKEKYASGELDNFEEFDNIRKKVNICIITVEEDNRLNKYRDKMPEGTDWKNNDGDKFARYRDLDVPINIYSPKE